MYDLAALEAELAGTIFASKLYFNSVTASTNTDALTAARNGAPHGSIFFADEQTAGRGRGDHSWESKTGEGLYVSVLLRPDIQPAYLPMIPLATGLAAAQGVKIAAGLNVDIRWPNDLLIGDRKTGGILVESKTDSGGAIFAIVGIGINVHQQDFDSDLSTAATSLDIESGRVISRQTLLIALLKSLQQEVRGCPTPWLLREFLRAWRRCLRGSGTVGSRYTGHNHARVLRQVWTRTVFCWCAPIMEL